MATNVQLVASIVHIDVSADVPAADAVAPKLANVYYTHDGGRGDEMRPHRIVWEAIGLRPGDRIEIRLLRDMVRSSTRGLKSHEAMNLLEACFPGARAQAEPDRGTPAGLWWELPQAGTSYVESGPVDLPNDDDDRINLRYRVTLIREGRTSELDPDINLLPDP